MTTSPAKTPQSLDDLRTLALSLARGEGDVALRGKTASVFSRLVDALRILFDRGDAALPIHRSAPDDPDHENTLATAVFSIQADRVEWSVYDGDAAAARAAA